MLTDSYSVGMKTNPLIEIEEPDTRPNPDDACMVCDKIECVCPPEQDDAFTPSEFRDRIALQLMPPTPLEVLDKVVTNYKTRIAKLEGTLLGIKLALQQQGGFEHTISQIDSVIFEEAKA